MAGVKPKYIKYAASCALAPRGSTAIVASGLAAPTAIANTRIRSHNHRSWLSGTRTKCPGLRMFAVTVPTVPPRIRVFMLRTAGAEKHKKRSPCEWKMERVLTEPKSPTFRERGLT